MAFAIERKRMACQRKLANFRDKLLILDLPYSQAHRIRRATEKVPRGIGLEVLGEQLSQCSC